MILNFPNKNKSKNKKMKKLQVIIFCGGFFEYKELIILVKQKT